MNINDSMREVKISFPNNAVMIDYILAQQLSRIDSDSLHHAITGYLTEEQIVAALLYYDGELFVIKPADHFLYQ